MKANIANALNKTYVWIDDHKVEIIGAGIVIGAAVVFRNGYYKGCINGATKVLGALEEVNPEVYRTLMDEAIAKGATVRF